MAERYESHAILRRCRHDRVIFDALVEEPEAVVSVLHKPQIFAQNARGGHGRTVRVGMYDAAVLEIAAGVKRLRNKL